MNMNDKKEMEQLLINYYKSIEKNVRETTIRSHVNRLKVLSKLDLDISNVDDTIKKIQTSIASIDPAIQQEGKGKVETIKEDDTITLDNFMDDMSNMLKDKDVEVKNEKGEYTLFDDANDVG